MLSLKNVSKSSTRYISSLFHHTSPPPPHFSTALALTTTLPTFTESIKAWFKSSKDSVFDKIFEILSTENEKEKQTQLILSQLGTRLSERLVLDVLQYGDVTKKDVLSCLKFFDWAGRQHGFFHTNATFHAIFKILTRAKLMSLALDFLDGYMKQGFCKSSCRFYQTLVIGYAVSGKPSIALKLLGHMRFHGHDLDSFGYHVVLNALVEVGLFDAAQIIVRQIRSKGFESDVTHSILVKCFCRQGFWDEAEEFLRGVVAENCVGRSAGYGLAILVDGHCKKKRFEKAGGLIEEFKRLGVDTNLVYGIWLRDLVRAGMIDEALEFLKGKQSSEGYVPEAPQYNVLLCRLLREKKFSEAWHVMEDMKESQVHPNKVTMNAVFSLFCKAGMMDVALELFNSGPEFDYSWDSIAYNRLISSLCEYKHIDEAFKAFKIFSEEGYFPDRKTFHILASALCKKGETDMVMELIDAAQEWNITPNFSLYSKLIEALYRDGRLQRNDNLTHWDHNRLARGANRTSYLKIIYWLAGLDHGGSAFDLLVEMQEKGIVATRGSFRAVIRSLCSNGNVEGPLGKLLSCDGDETKTQTLSRIQIFNMFISGAGHVKKPKLARAMFEMIKANGLQPNLNSYILMLLSYLKNEEVSDAMDFFNTLPREFKKKKLYNTMIVGLCKLYEREKAESYVELALAYFIEARSNEIVPSWECYEELIKVLCMRKEYDKVIDILEDIETVEDRVTTYVGNTLLFQSLTSDELYKRWIQSKAAEKKPFSKFLNLVLLMGEFSGCIPTNRRIDEWEEVFEKCFPPDVYTYNILLTKFIQSNMSDAWWLFHRLRVRGLEPNRWTYDILLYGLFQHGRADEAKRWLDELTKIGFEPTTRTKRLAWGSYHSRPRYS